MWEHQIVKSEICDAKENIEQHQNQTEITEYTHSFSEP